MSFLIGKTQQRSNVTGETSQVYNKLLEYIMGQGFGGLNPSVSPDQASLEPYQRLFRQQNAQNFAQAKESAGNLTGSGFANYLGNAAATADAQQGAFLANLFEQRRQQDADRFLRLVLGSLGSPAGGVTQMYQPGFLDYAFQGIQSAAPFLAPGASAPKPAAG